ncbi:hypothetical protein [Nocardia carnea]|uniref:hypothetical protein n=1 Tax=Nocardia carnea TaxID=37328 RepID=UPI002456CFCB|nr:hypothetical protein [Nocardia carnea]
MNIEAWIGCNSAKKIHRVVVVGCGGSGKSFVARGIARALKLPVIHLDDIFFDNAWNPLPRSQFEEAQRILVAGGRWVIDGNYVSTMPIRLAVADTVVVMDYSTATALWGVFQRWWKHRSGQHADGVYVRVTVDFVRYVARFRKHSRPRMMQTIAEHARHAEVVHLPNRAAARRFLAAIDTAMASDGEAP